MTYYIGIDGGGTKTEGVLTTSEGVILARALCAATNPNDVTPAVSVSRLTDLCRSLLTTAGLTEADMERVSLFCGVAGGINHGPTLENALRAVFPRTPHIRVRSDAHILLSGELPQGDGACLICGTGSVCFLRLGSELHRIGGWGYLLDSGGSGYNIGRDALEAVLRAHDGRGEPTALTALVTAHLGGEAHTRITEIYREGKPYIASCAPLVFQAAEEKDAVAIEILRRNAAFLAELVEAAWKQFSATPGRTEIALPVVMGGGISKKCAPMWSELVASELKHGVQATFTVADAAPVFGAVAEAVGQASEGLFVDYKALRYAFTATYNP